MEKWGDPIEDAYVKSPINTGITHSSYYAEWDACLSVELNIEKWLLGKYPKWLKEHAIAFARGKNLIELHRQQELNKAQEREQRKNRLRGR